jgi:hypothetical protein
MTSTIVGVRRTTRTTVARKRSSSRPKNAASDNVDAPGNLASTRDTIG